MLWRGIKHDISKFSPAEFFECANNYVEGKTPLAVIKEKYGENKVGQIITFNSMAAKASLKDVARVLNISFQESNEITKAFPPKVDSIEEALEMSNELKSIRDRNETNKNCITASIIKR